MEQRIRSVLREHYGVFKTTLENLYEDTITENLLIDDDIHRLEWATYNQVILELKKNLKKNHQKIQELQFKLSNDDDPNQVCIEVIQDVDFVSEELERLYYKIHNFID